MRLIDADKIPWTDLADGRAPSPVLVTFADKVNKMPTIEPEPHWIPCSEKYPDQDERVIVTIGGYNIWVWDCMANRGDDYFWEDEQGFYHNKYEIDAWMPLPEPYREGES